MEQERIIPKISALTAAVIIIGGAVLFWGSSLLSSASLQRGIKAFERGEYARAAELINRSLLLGKDQPEAFYYLGRIALGKPSPELKLNTDAYYPNADYEKALLYFERAVSTGLRDTSVDLHRSLLLNSGLAAYELKRYDRAVAFFEESIRLYPDRSFLPRYWLAFYYFDHANKPREALNVLLPAESNAWLDAYRERLFRIHILLARLYTYFGDFAEAERYARLVVKGAPAKYAGSEDIQIAHILLAGYAGRKKDFKGAEAEIQLAEASAGTGVHICPRARSYFYGGDYGRAIAIAKQGMDASRPPRAAQICLYTLGNSYLAMGNAAEAKNYLERFLAFTADLALRNIFILREEAEVAAALQKISQAR